MKTEYREVGPAEAAGLLKFNTHNRPLNRARVQRMARDITLGRWAFNPRASVIIGHGEDGTVLADGQHKLCAIVEADKAASVMIFLLEEGEDWREAQANVDSNAGPRGFGDELAMRGVPNARRAASVTRMLYYWESGVRARGGPVVPTLGELADFHSEHETEIARGVLLAKRANDAIRLAIPAGGVAAVLYSRISARFVDGFFSAVATGAMLEKGAPELAIRNRILAEGSRIDSWTQLGMLIQAMNASVAGRSLSIVRVPHLTDDRGRTSRRFPPDSFPAPSWPTTAESRAAAK